MRRIGVDVGGTFTDLILVDEAAGAITVDKVPSTPDDPARAVMTGVDALCGKAGVSLEAVDLLLHGTTVATNIAIEHKGAEVGLITTEGFRDILHIARHKKPHNFSLQQELPWQSRPLVRRRHRLTVKERVTAPKGGQFGRTVGFMGGTAGAGLSAQTAIVPSRYCTARPASRTRSPATVHCTAPPRVETWWALSVALLRRSAQNGASMQ